MMSFEELERQTHIIFEEEKRFSDLIAHLPVEKQLEIRFRRREVEALEKQAAQVKDADFNPLAMAAAFCFGSMLGGD